MKLAKCGLFSFVGLKLHGHFANVVGEKKAFVCSYIGYSSKGKCIETLFPRGLFRLTTTVLIFMELMNVLVKNVLQEQVAYKTKTRKINSKVNPFGILESIDIVFSV